MQARVVQGGKSSFNALLYSTPNQNTLNWLNNNLVQAKEMLCGVGDSLVNAASSLYNKVNSYGVISAAKELVAHHGGHVSDMMIYAHDYTNIQQANYINQQYIMANPMVQAQYQDNLIAGYPETYYDPEPGVVGRDRMDFQRVDDGVLHTDDDGCYINHYSNTDEVELATWDKFAILDTWEQAEHMLLNDMDPTDPDTEYE